MARLRSKSEWARAVGAAKKSKRLQLIKNASGIFECPLRTCDHNGFETQRGCRKHVFTKHAWMFWFNERPDLVEAFPGDITRIAQYTLPKRCQTRHMPTFNLDCVFARNMMHWLRSDGGGGKNVTQSKQITTRALKFLRFCCEDADDDWEIPTTVVDFCIGSIDLIGKFFEHLRDDMNMAPSGCIGYLNAIGHLMDFRKVNGITENVRKTLFVTEIYTCRIRKTIAKRMKLEYTTILDVDHLDSQGCWSTIDDMKKVIPFHQKTFKTIVDLCKSGTSTVSPHQLTFSTNFIVALLFLEVKASRPMTYQYLTLPMLEAVNKDGIIDQTSFKTNLKYGFDSLIFSADVLELVKNYVDYVRPRLNPQCEYLLVTRTGKQLTKLSSSLGKLVFEAIGKYIHPTRLRQIIETSSGKLLSLEEQQIISEDQKHSSKVAKIHYKKLRSREIALKGKTCMIKLQNMSCRKEQEPLEEAAIENCTVNETHSPVDSVQEISPQSPIETPKQPEADSECSITKVTRSIKRSFSQQEDICIKKGVQKYGWGNWTLILSDPDYDFHCNRCASTLHRRATILKQKGFIDV